MWHSIFPIPGIEPSNNHIGARLDRDICVLRDTLSERFCFTLPSILPK